MFQMTVAKRYLWFPVKNGATVQKINVRMGQQDLYEFDIETSESGFDFFGCWDAGAYLGKTLDFAGGFSKAWFEAIRNEDTSPEQCVGCQRPKIHFTADTGWINDPNGMIRIGDVYHMYFQHNPYGTIWGNMHWGHAQSTDLFHWEQSGDVLEPDATGTMFSGCAIQDRRNAAGLGGDTVLYYYTAASKHSTLSKDQKTTQRLAYSTDGGDTLVKSDLFLLEHIVDENRDPKVFYHQESGHYIMVLYLEGNDFAIFRSKDLLHWELTQKLTLDKAWECPDLFQLAVDGNPDNRRWVFWSADGFYFLGDFDGREFTPKTERLNGYATKLAYAAQTYSGIDPRVVSQAWLRTKNYGTNFTGLMAIPVELGLVTTEEGERLQVKPVAELQAAREQHIPIAGGALGTLMELSESAAELCCRFAPAKTGNIRLNVLGAVLEADFESGKVTFGEEGFWFDPARGLSMQIFVDYGVVEIFAQDGTVYFPCEQAYPSLTGKIALTVTGDCRLEAADGYLLKTNR